MKMIERLVVFTTLTLSVLNCSRGHEVVGSNEDTTDTQIIAVSEESLEQLSDSLIVLDSLIANESDSTKKATLQAQAQRQIEQLQAQAVAQQSEQELIVAMAKSYLANLKASNALLAEIAVAKQDLAAAEAKLKEMNVELATLTDSLGIPLSSSPQGTNESAEGGVANLSSSSGTIKYGASSNDSESVSGATSSGMAVGIISNITPVINTGTAVTVEMSEDGVPTPFALTLNASDGDGDILTWNIVEDTDVGTVDYSVVENAATIAFVPNQNYFGTTSFILSVSDSSSSDSITVTVVVAPVNDAPDYAGGAVVSGDKIEGSTIEIEAGAVCVDTVDTDDAPSFSYRWYRDPGMEVFNTDLQVGGNKLYQLEASDVGNYLFGVVTCTDVDGIAVSDTSDYTSQIDIAPSGTGPNALDFDGVDDYVSIPEIIIDMDNGFTIEAWVLWGTGSPTNSALIDFGQDQADDNIVLRKMGDQITFQMFVDNSMSEVFSTSGFVVTNHWTHIAVSVASDGTVSLYKNGALDTTKVLGIAVDDIVRDKNFIGFNNWGTQSHLGLIEDVRLWETARTESEIQNALFASFTNSEEHLLAAWNCNTTDGTILYDINTAYSGRLVNMSDDDWVMSFSSYVLTLNADGGTVVNEGNNTLAEGMLFSAMAVETEGYTFNKWEVTGGVAIVEDTLSDTTFVQLTSDDATMTAQFNRDTIHIEFEKDFDQQTRKNELIKEDNLGVTSVGWITNVGQKLDWEDVYLTKGVYEIKVRLATWDNGFERKIQFLIDDQFKSEQVCLPSINTGGYFDWEVVRDGRIVIENDGEYKVTADFWARDYNVDWFEFIPVSN
ncbi:MAG: DUF5010 C-terminal domain-containing protein [Colwellia sp.]